MPTLWQASQRPMYIRTVWVGDFRHAILSYDDPYLAKFNNKARPRSSPDVIKPYLINKNRKSSPSPDKSYIRNFDIGIKSEKSNIAQKFCLTEKVFIEQLDFNDIESQCPDESLLKSNLQTLGCFDVTSKHNGCSSMRTLKTNRTARNEQKKDTELSDRVLQWLDLAGKVDLLAPDNMEKMAQPRHSWPSIDQRNVLMKSKTNLDMVGKESPDNILPKAGDSKMQIGSIDRQNVYVPTSATTIEKYARQSRKKRDQHAPSLHRHAIQLTTSNIGQARHQIALGRNAVHKHHARVVTQTFLPDLGKNNKKQVHIFIPAIPHTLGSIVSNTT